MRKKSVNIFDSCDIQGTLGWETRTPTICGDLTNYCNVVLDNSYISAYNEYLAVTSTLRNDYTKISTAFIFVYKIPVYLNAQQRTLF
jgi:hypothetical protein